MIHLLSIIGLTPGGRVLPTVVRRCVWSRNLMQEKTLAHWGAGGGCCAKNKQRNEIHQSSKLYYFLGNLFLCTRWHIILSTILTAYFHGLIYLQIIPRFMKQFLAFYTTPTTNARLHQPTIDSYPQLHSSGTTHHLPPTHTNISTNLCLDMSSNTNTKATKPYTLVSGKMLLPSSG